MYIEIILGTKEVLFYLRKTGFLKLDKLNKYFSAFFKAWIKLQRSGWRKRQQFDGAGIPCRSWWLGKSTPSPHRRTWRTDSRQNCWSAECHSGFSSVPRQPRGVQHWVVGTLDAEAEVPDVLYNLLRIYT